VLRTESVSLFDQYKKTQIKEIAKQLDRTNIRILSAMWKYGPRNLLEVSRRTGIPFTSVYHRMTKIESKAEETTYLIPSVSGLGMVRTAVLVTAAPGCEDEVTRALKAPNLWRSIGPCEGTFTHISVQLVPVKFLREFKSYIQQLVDKNLITNFNLIYTGDYVSNFPDFDYYDPVKSEWKFDWEGWLSSLSEKHAPDSIDDPEGYTLIVDKKDLMIMKELERDGRKSFADVAQATGMTPQSVSYRFDQKLVASGVARCFQFRIHPFPIEVLAYHQLMLEFSKKEDMEKFFSIVPKLFFIVGVAKVLRQNALMVETWMLESQLQNMFAFFSHMARAGFLKSYSAVRMDFRSRLTQTISDELFDDERGWVVDFEGCSSELSKIQTVESSR
jgi:DNA-binding Lrp family transcriptional regulator